MLLRSLLSLQNGLKLEEIFLESKDFLLSSRFLPEFPLVAKFWPGFGQQTGWECFPESQKHVFSHMGSGTGKGEPGPNQHLEHTGA